MAESRRSTGHVRQLAAFLAYSAARKLSHDEEVVRSYARAGVPEDKLDRLALLLLAGAAGPVIGVFWPPIGIAAALRVTCYFLVAVGFHVPADDMRRLPTPLTIALLAALVLVLQVATPEGGRKTSAPSGTHSSDTTRRKECPGAAGSTTSRHCTSRTWTAR